MPGDITPKEVKARGRVHLTMHARLAKGGWMRTYGCREFPPLVKTVTRKDRNSPIITTLFVDGEEIEQSYEAIAAALNKLERKDDDVRTID